MPPEPAARHKYGQEGFVSGAFPVRFHRPQEFHNEKLAL